MDQSQQKSQRGQPADAIQALSGVANVVATCVSPFVRSGFGREALGMNALCAFILMALYTAYTPRMVLYIEVWLLMLLYRRIEGLRRKKPMHSRWGGSPWLAKIFVIEKEAWIVEPMLVGFLGMCLSLWSYYVGCLVIAGGAALFVRHVIDQLMIRNRLQKMRDAEIEGSYYAGRIRE